MCDKIRKVTDLFLVRLNPSNVVSEISWQASTTKSLTAKLALGPSLSSFPVIISYLEIPLASYSL